MSHRALLLVIEHGYRGTVEVGFSDLLYVCRGLHRQLGGADIVLRGSAVTFAVRAASVPPVRIGTGFAGAKPDPRGSLRELLDDGVRAWVDERDLRHLGFGADQVIEGVVPADTAELAVRWPDYRGVWFL
jgi:hypothetical protein